MPTVMSNNTSIFYEDSGGQGPAVHIAGQALLGRDDVQPRAGEITCPVMAAHAPNMSHPELTNSTLAGFLGSLETA